MYRLKELPLQLARETLSMLAPPEMDGNVGSGGQVNPVNLTVESVGPQSIFTPGDTNRYYVSSNTSYPARASGHWSSLGCTGFFVGPRSIVTAAHCFYSRSSKTFLATGDFVPGKQTSGQQEPWGRWSIAYFYVPNAYIDPTKTNNEARQFDFAVAELKIAPGYTGSPGWYGTTTSMAGTFTVFGYPGDKPTGSLWGKTGTILTPSDSSWWHRIDCVGGDSGAALIDSSNRMTGVHRRSDVAYNYARKYDSFMYNFIRDYTTAW